MTTLATKRAMVTAMRVADNKEGNGNSSGSDGHGNTGGKHATATRAIAMVMAMRGQ